MLLLAACWPASIGAANHVPIRIEVLSAPAIDVREGALHPEPPRYRITHADSGLPVAGGRFFVSIGVIQCDYPGSCEESDPAHFGTFEGADPDEPRDLVRIADADGIVTALPLRAGRGTNVYPIFISPAQEPPPWIEVVGGEPRILVSQHLAAPIRSIPAAGGIGPWLLALALASLALRRIR